MTVDQKGKKFVVAIEKTKDKSWRDSLVFFQKSPDYYVPDLSLPGTTGRVCYNGTRPQPRVTGHMRLCAVGAGSTRSKSRRITSAIAILSGVVM